MVVRVLGDIADYCSAYVAEICSLHLASVFEQGQRKPVVLLGTECLFELGVQDGVHQQQQAVELVQTICTLFK